MQNSNRRKDHNAEQLLEIMQYSTRRTYYNVEKHQENILQCSITPGEQATMQYSTRRTGYNAVQHQDINKIQQHTKAIS